MDCNTRQQQTHHEIELQTYTRILHTTNNTKQCNNAQNDDANNTLPRCTPTKHMTSNALKQSPTTPHTIDSSLSISCLLHTTSIAYATSNHCVSPSRHASSSRARIPVPIVLPPLPPCIMYSRSEAGSCVSRFETTVSCASFASRPYCSWAVNQCHLMYPIG